MRYDAVQSEILYHLRRWRRAIGWLAVTFGVSVLFVDQAALAALASGSGTDPWSLAPVFVVSMLSVIDAYVVAHAQNLVRRMRATTDGHRTHCPNCGKELDPELSFCQWCSTEVDRFEERPDVAERET